ncbi:hypothetical protein LCGC14_0823270 [marine sediment metagenome]|uniref:DNA methylase N-4/N-6 domain-containing protein n=1 Tax=marine sediment metagenome TaxID=412755 RepID=A0A0F9SQP7_9ZZZZ|nr:hypothetical protein [Candidatus Scalindua sp.]
MKSYYSEDGITIYHGDCLDILPQLEKVDLVLTDPPYGVDFAEWDSGIPEPVKWMGTVEVKTILITPGNGNQHFYPSPDWTLCWFRPGSVQRVRKGTGFSHWEPILLYGENNFSIDAKKFDANTNSKHWGHPCPKPLDLFKWLIQESETILDPFMGSGTTLVAAKQLGRKAIGIEIEEKYCEIAVKRLAQRELFNGVYKVGP